MHKLITASDTLEQITRTTIFEESDDMNVVVNEAGYQMATISLTNDWYPPLNKRSQLVSSSVNNNMVCCVFIYHIVTAVHNLYEVPVGAA